MRCMRACIVLSDRKSGSELAATIYALNEYSFYYAAATAAPLAATAAAAAAVSIGG